MGMQRILHGRQDAEILFVEQTSAVERCFDAADAGIGQLYIAGELVDEVVCARPKRARLLNRRGAQAQDLRALRQR